MSRTARMLAGALVVAVAADRTYAHVLRPWHLRWGATDDELARPMPGDDQVLGPVVLSTRAVTIEAEPSAIWPWLAQMGDGRGGLYSYDLLDRIFGYLHAPSAREILPQWQDIHAGSRIPLGRGPSWPVTHVDTERFLVLTPVDTEITAVTWAFGLYPVDAYTTRLVTRVRARFPITPFSYIPSVALDAAAFVMTRRMLLNLKQRAEHVAHERIFASDVRGVDTPRPRLTRRRMPVTVG